jgi:hypothetical protein
MLNYLRKLKGENKRCDRKNTLRFMMAFRANILTSVSTSDVDFVSSAIVIDI